MRVTQFLFKNNEVVSIDEREEGRELVVSRMKRERKKISFCSVGYDSLVLIYF